MTKQRHTLKTTVSSLFGAVSMSAAAVETLAQGANTWAGVLDDAGHIARAEVRAFGEISALERDIDMSEMRATLLALQSEG